MAGGRRDRRALALATGSAVALAAVVAQSVRAQEYVDAALVEALGPDYRDRLSATYTDLDLSTPLSQLAMPFRLHDDEVEVVKDLPYDTGHGKRGLLDVYRQRDADLTRAPVLLQVHGGAWSVGDKEHQGIPLMLHMAARGWVCVTINYRLSPRDPFPAHVVDVKRAIAWIREHGPAYGADPAFLAITGGSAGGHLAALAALTPNDPEYQPGFEDADTSVQAAVPHYGVYDFAGATGGRAAQLHARPLPGAEGDVQGPGERPRGLRAGLAAAAGERRRPAVLRGARPQRLAGRVHQARTFVAALRKVSHRPVAYAELPGTQHAFDVFPSIRSARSGPRRRPFPAVHLRRVGRRPDHRMSGLPEPLRTKALAAKGFMPEDEGALLHRRRGRAARRRPGAGGRHLLRQVRDLPRRRGPRGRAAPSSPSTTTAARRRTRPAGSTTTPTLVDPEFGLMDTLPVFRRTIARAGLEDEVVAVVGRSHDGRRALAHAAGAAVHRRRPRRGARRRTTTPAGRRWVAARRRARHPRRLPATRGRRPGAVPRLPAGAGERRLRPRPRRSARCGC